MELGANYLLERGILVTYVGWQREDRKFLQELDLEQISSISPDIAQSIADDSDTERVENLLISAFPGVNSSRAKKAIEELRKNGKTELPTVRRQVDAPEVKTLAPDGDFFFPSYVTDPQRAPYCFWRTYYTAQELENKVVTDGWDQDFVDVMIERYRGININSIENEQEGRRSGQVSDTIYESDDLIEIVYGYQRLFDEEDGSEGIYCTVFHKDYSGGDESPAYAKFELLNGYEDYPVVVTKLSEDSKRLYDTMTIPNILRGIQNQVKVERDSRIDRNSIATLPPILHPVGQAPTDWGPGRMIPYRRKGDLDFAPVPPAPTGSIEVEQTLETQADALVGLDVENPLAPVRRQFLIDKFLNHSAEVLRMTWKCFQRFGPDQVFFKVTGSPDPMKFSKGDPNEDYDIVVSYDVLNTDKETQERKLQSLVSLTQLDRSGRIDVDALLETVANSIDPVMADSILREGKAAEQEMVRDVTDDLAKIFAGIEMPARPNGAQVAMKLLQQYTQQPDIAQRLQTDQGFKARLEKYIGQYTFMQQQAQNAQIGKIGTQPAGMGNVGLQSINQ
jgi:hypothetical protein